MAENSTSRIVILGAAGRDFHNFNMVYRDDPTCRVAAFTATLAVTATGFAYFVHALTPAPGTRFDTNYLDLRDGETATIQVTGLPQGLDPESIEVRAWQSKHR